MPCSISKLTALMTILALATLLSAMVPPHPNYANPPQAWQSTKIEGSVFTAGKASRPPLPNNILVLRVQFSDKAFKSTASYPDFLAHDEAFFDRWMIHLKDFYLEASHGLYELEYHLFPQVLTMPNTMAYYGADATEKIDANLPQMLPHIMALIDNEVEFTDYGGVIIFHAGAGQESDIEGIRGDEIWSTFLTRKNLQAAFEPDNDNYPGFVTDDGAILTNVVVIPEDEYQDYFPAEGEDNASAYLFSIYGVLAHQFGHVLGLPTLFDNDSSNGRSQGIGNWGLMGTGVWNGNGYVPAQPMAYSRYLLGWETPVVISQDSPLNAIDYFLNHSETAIRTYKIPLTDSEYFLIENRQQNPDASLDPYSNQHSYSFKLLPEGEQDYYTDYPLLPYFNFMENSYLGSEWDFFLPGLGGPIPNNMAMPADGSGLLIWHIDEAVIDATFTANFDLNRINANAMHKGVDLEEADGIQNLDTSVADIYKWGSPYDSFRADNNAYFGYQNHNGLLSLPVADSYYGGVPVQIADISASGLQMTFSVDFGWSLTSSYAGENPVGAAAIDFDGDGENEIFYPMPDGQLYLWDNEELAFGFPLQRMPVTQTYVWDTESLYIPMEQASLCRLYKLGNQEREYVFTLSGAQWASHPVNAGTRLLLPFNLGSTSSVKALEKSSGEVTELTSFMAPLAANLIVLPNAIEAITEESDGSYMLHELGLDGTEVQSYTLPVPADSTVVAAFRVVFGERNLLIVQCPNSIYAVEDGFLATGFPFVHNLITVSDSTNIAPLSFADVDGNGTLDILAGGGKGFAVIDHFGNLMSPESLLYSNEPGTTNAAGIFAMDIDADDKMEIVGSFENNRMSVWEHDYRQKGGYPVAFAQRSRTLPFAAIGNDNKWYLYSATDNGSLFRKALDDTPEDLNNSWHSEYGSLLRTSSIVAPNLPNQYDSREVFVPGQVYIYPNPLKSIYNQKLTLNIMPTEDTEIELSIYDISGALVLLQKGIARAYLRNLDITDIPVDKLSSGVYIAVVKSPLETKTIKFAVEK